MQKTRLLPFLGSFLLLLLKRKNFRKFIYVLHIREDMPNHSELQLPDGWLRLETPLTVAVKRLYSFITQEDVSPNQDVRRSVFYAGGGECPDSTLSINISVQPAGIDVEYTRKPSDMVIVSEGDRILRIDENIIVRRGKGAVQGIEGAFLLSKETGFICVSDREPLLGGLGSLGAEEVSARLMRMYTEALFSQAQAAVALDGIAALPVEMMGGFRGVVRKLNLAQIGGFNDLRGNPYSPEFFQSNIVSALIECYPRISCVDYDNLYIIGRSLLIDCGDRSVLEAIVKNGDDRGRKTVDACADSYAKNAGRMSVYEHNDALSLVERVFPESGSVYLYSLDEGVVSRIASSFLFQQREKARTSVEGGWLVLGSRGLRISFLGRPAEPEFDSQKSLYDRNRGSIERGNSVKGLLDEF
jgi:hypothetical protein